MCRRWPSRYGRCLVTTYVHTKHLKRLEVKGKEGYAGGGIRKRPVTKCAPHARGKLSFVGSIVRALALSRGKSEERLAGARSKRARGRIEKGARERVREDAGCPLLCAHVSWLSCLSVM